MNSVKSMPPARISLLWVDFTSGGSTTVPPGFVDHFSVVACPAGQSVVEVIEQVMPQAICFEFDYPDRERLREAADIKTQYARLPMFLLTVQHSEQLAVWTFRTRFCDYLVQPVSSADIERVHGLLAEIAGFKDRQPQRAVAKPALPMPAEAGRAGRPSGRSALLPALYFVQEHYRDKIESAEVATLCGMSPFRFSRVFHETYGLTFRDYVVRYRLKEAKRLLRNPQASITDVAFAVGFNDLSYFSRMFRRYFGTAPSALLNRIEAAAAKAASRTAAPRAETDNPETGSTTIMLRLPQPH